MPHRLEAHSKPMKDPAIDSTPGTPPLDPDDKRLLNLIQQDFPLSPRPWDELAKDSDLTGEQVLSKIKRLKADGIIRQISAIFDTKALGYTSTLAAARVPEDRLQQAADVVSRHPGVSHNYKREAGFNLWFTLAVPPGESLDEHLKRMSDEAGFEDLLPLPTIRTFRIGVKLDVQADGPSDETPDASSDANHQGKQHKRHGAKSQPVTLTELDRSFVRVLQKDIPLVDQPFDEACRELGVGFDVLADWMRRMQEAGALRRFAGILHHRQAGFVANAMVVWPVPDGQIEQAGQCAAKAPEVSHCYQRPTNDDWPYNLYTMIHARSEVECQRVIDRIASELEPMGVTEHRALYSTVEYKKQRVSYFPQ